MNINKNDLNTIIDELNMMIAVMSKDNTLVSANKIMLDFAGVSLNDVKGEALWDLPWLKHDVDLQNKLLFAITDSYMGESSRFNASYKSASGEVHEIDFIVKPIMKDGEPEYFVTMGYNITELVGARKALTERERRIKAFFKYSSEGYFFLSLPDILRLEDVCEDIINEVLDHYKLEDVNEKFVDMVGQSVDSSQDIFEALELNDGLIDTMKTMIVEGSIGLERKVNNKHLEILIVAIYDQGAFEGCFGIVRDITEQVEHIEQITYLANKDYLTGINNRRNFFAEGYKRFASSAKNDGAITVAMFDIDHFKRVNDTYGHDAGDVVIRDIAQLVEGEMCDKCVLGRYGGEEYIVLLPEKMDKVYKKFEHIRKSIESHVFDPEHKPIHVTVSVGLYQINFEIDTLETAITKADKALYESKENGRNQSTIFMESIHGESALDPLTNLFTDVSMRYKLNKSLYDVKMMGDSLWMLYFKLDVMKEDRLLTEPRHYKTIALCLKKSIRNSDYIGRIGKHGFLVVLRNINMKQVEDKHQSMVENFEIGFSGMINNVVTIKSCFYNASMSSNVDQILEDMNKQLENIY